MVLERRGDFSLILARALRWRKRERKKKRRRKSMFGSLEISYSCMEFMFGTLVYVGMEPMYGFVG